MFFSRPPATYRVFFSRPYIRPPVCVRSRACASVPVRLNPIIRLRPSSYVHVRLRPCPYVCVRACTSASVPIRLRPCPCVCVRACACVCVHIIKVQTRLHALSAMRLDAFFAQGPSRCTIYKIWGGRKSPESDAAKVMVIWRLSFNQTISTREAPSCSIVQLDDGTMLMPLWFQLTTISCGILWTAFVRVRAFAFI